MIIVQCTQYTKNNGGHYMRAAPCLLNKGPQTLTFVKFSFGTLQYSGSLKNLKKMSCQMPQRCKVKLIQLFLLTLITQYCD